MNPYVLATTYKDYEISNDLIIFKENGNIVYEFPIPKGYKLILIKENYHADYYFVFSKNKLEPPKYIPKGYTNLTMSSKGLYQVEKEASKYPVKNKNGENTYITTEKRKLYYMDTSIITPNDFMAACNNFYKVNEEEMPQSFWFSTQYRSFYNDFRCAFIGSSYGWHEGCYNCDISDYIQKFDSNLRLINEYELIAIDAYNGNGNFEPLLLLLDDDLWNKYCTFNKDCKVCIGKSHIETENWWKVVSSIENPNINLQIYDEKIDVGYCKFERICNNHPDGEIKNRFVIPVIDEETVKKKYLVNNNSKK